MQKLAVFMFLPVLLGRSADGGIVIGKVNNDGSQQVHGGGLSYNRSNRRELIDDEESA